MAISAGEIEATLRLRDELTGQLRQVTDKLKGFGVEAGKAQSGPLKEFQGRLAQIKSELGPLAPAMAGAFSVAAIGNFARVSIQAASNIGDLAESSRISFDSLQKLQYVFAGSPQTINEVAQSIDALSRNLASGQAAESIERLRISTSALRGQRPEQAFLTVAEAIGKLNDPMRQAQIRFELLGKASATMSAETLKNIKEEFDKAPALMTDATIKMAAAFEKGMAQLAIRAKAAAASVLFPELPTNVKLSTGSMQMLPAIDLPIPGAPNMVKAELSDVARRAAMMPTDAEAKNVERNVNAILMARARFLADTIRFQRAIETMGLPDTSKLLFFVEPTQTGRSLLDLNLSDLPGSSGVPSADEFERIRMAETERRRLAGPLSPEMLPGFKSSQDIWEEKARSDAQAAQKSMSTSWRRYFASEFGSIIVAAAAGGGNKWAALGASIGNQLGQSLNEALKLKMGTGILGSLGSGLLSAGLGLGISALFGLFGGDNDDSGRGSGIIPDTTSPAISLAPAQPQVIVVHINDDSRRVLKQIQHDVRTNKDGIRTDLRYDLGIT